MRHEDYRTGQELVDDLMDLVPLMIFLMVRREMIRSSLVQKRNLELVLPLRIAPQTRQVKRLRDQEMLTEVPGNPRKEI